MWGRNIMNDKRKLANLIHNQMTHSPDGDGKEKEGWERIEEDANEQPAFFSYSIPDVTNFDEFEFVEEGSYEKRILYKRKK